MNAFCYLPRFPDLGFVLPQVYFFLKWAGGDVS